MWDQPKVTTFDESEFFKDGSGARMPVPGTVPRGQLNEDELLHQGTENGEVSTRFPYRVTKAMLESGRERFDIFCLPCHGQSGDGQGMIVQRGFQQPKPLTDATIVSRPVGYYFGVLTRGFDILNGISDPAKQDKVHPPLGKVMSPDEKWATVAYIRALQRSQSATVADVPQDERAKMDNPNQGGAPSDH
jgi:hypothetical protein